MAGAFNPYIRMKGYMTPRGQVNREMLRRRGSAAGELLQPWRGAGRHAVDVGFGRADSNAGGEVLRLDLDELGFDVAACRHRVRTTCVKAAARWWIDGRG